MKTLKLLASLALLLGCPASVLADAATDKVRVAYAGQCHDFLTNDWTSYNDSMLPGFTARAPDGSVQTRAQSVNDMRRYANAIKVNACDPQIQSVNVSGNQFVTTVLLKLSSIALAAIGKQIKKGDQVDATILAVDTWIQRSDGSLALSSSTAKGTQTVINGKLVERHGQL